MHCALTASRALCLLQVQKLPKPFRKRLREFFHQTQDCAREEGFDELFLRMSDRLRSETAQVPRGTISSLFPFCLAPLMLSVAILMALAYLNLGS